MTSFTDADVADVCSGTVDWVDAEGVAALAEHPLDGIETEFPHAVRRMESADGPERPRERSPVFYGCYDWHSAVHSHWALVRQLRLFEHHPDEEAIVERIDDRFTDDDVAREVEHLEANPSFERPYGWAWLLHLASELDRWDDERADEWADVLAPLEATVVELVESEFLTRDRPIRVGTHGNSAFALHCVLDYARSTGDDALESAAVETARSLFGDDRDYPVEYEPLGWDFLSPALTEADLMRRVYDPRTFRSWLEDFLPDVTESPDDAVFDPVSVDAEEGDGAALHLVGLNVSRAWSLLGVADALDEHRFVEPLERSARAHAEAGLAQAFTDDYAGAHWLSSFVVYLLTRNERGIAPPA